MKSILIFLMICFYYHNFETINKFLVQLNRNPEDYGDSNHQSHVIVAQRHKYFQHKLLESKY